MTDSRSDPILLGVNIDHVATLRQARGAIYPEPVQAALAAEQAGADAITVHLREDRRHIQDRDVTLLAGVLQTRMNLEVAINEEMLGIAERVAPADCCLVPERREEITTEGGLGVRGNEPAVRAACEQLAKVGVRVSLFIDPDPEQVRASHDAGAPVIEIHTGRYAEARGHAERAVELRRLRDVVEIGLGLGLHVNAGHGLHYHNVQPVAAIEGIRELNIGHAIVARAIFTGLDEAVSTMKRLMTQARERDAAGG